MEELITFTLLINLQVFHNDSYHSPSAMKKL